MSRTVTKLKIKIPLQRSYLALIAKSRTSAGPMNHRLKQRGGGGSKTRAIQEGW